MLIGQLCLSTVCLYRGSTIVNPRFKDNFVRLRILSVGLRLGVRGLGLCLY